MTLNCDELQQLTALEAAGALDGDEAARLRARLEQDPAARAELARFLDAAAAALAGGLRRVRPSAGVRTRILERIRKVPQVRPGPPPAGATADAGVPAGPTSEAPGLPPLRAGFHFVMHDAPWLPAPLPGARMKVLSAGPGQDYAMLLVEIGPGVVYPEHDHLGAEEMYVLTGDLQSEGRSLGPGDLLHAEPGTHHLPLRSIGGCTAIMVVSRAALEAATVM